MNVNVDRSISLKPSPQDIRDSTGQSVRVDRGNPRHFTFDNIPQTTVAFSHIVLWADYFNNMKKCWEPLLERLNVSVLYEYGPVRGFGITVRTSSSIHLNVSGALIRAVGDAVKMVQSTYKYHTEKENERISDKSIIPVQSNDITSQSIAITKPQIYEDIHPINSYNQRRTHLMQSSSDDVLLTLAQRYHVMGNTSDAKGYNLSNDLENDSLWKKRSSGITYPSSDLAYTEDLTIHRSQTNILKDNIRVGFSMQNMTGQPVRYLQLWSDGNWIVQYINHNERGLLNFIASKTLIRNNKLVEEAFNVQMFSGEKDASHHVGHEVTLQVRY